MLCWGSALNPGFFPKDDEHGFSRAWGVLSACIWRQMSVGQNGRREGCQCCIVWLLLRVSVRILSKRNERVAACVQRNPEVILELVHFGHAVDHIQCYCKSKR